jgi:hypothetical protein
MVGSVRAGGRSSLYHSIHIAVSYCGGIITLREGVTVPFIRRFVVALVLAPSATMLIPAVPAHAGDRVRLCAEVVPDAPQTVRCVDVHVDIHVKPPFPPGCLVCAPVLDFWDHKLDFQIRDQYLEQLGKGFGLLSQSNRTEDPKLAAQLRADATDAFLASAAIVGDHEVPLNQVGWFDLKSGKIYWEPDPDPILAGLGNHLAEGLRLTQLALADPSPQSSLEAALKHFDQAHANLSSLYGG